MSRRVRLPQETPVLKVEVLETATTPRDGWHACIVGRHVRFSTDALESYCFAEWQPVVYDMLLLAAAVEFADKTCKRPAYGWGRSFDLTVPVHEPDRWNAAPVAATLRHALEFLTGDGWNLSFRPRSAPLDHPQRNELSLPPRVDAVIPFSDGLDSRAVAALMERSLGSALVRVRLGSARDASAKAKRKPLAAIPYRVSVDAEDREPSGRARGFKFTLIAGIAAYLSNAGRVVMPESAQGALGPVLVPVAYAYEDYRNHPLFTDRMSRLLHSLLGHQITYEFPRLWNTKAETIAAALELEPAANLLATRTCWQRSQQVAVDPKRRQCGICAACLLRRMSLHSAGLSDPPQTYVWENLSSNDFRLGAAASLNPRLITESQREYAIAGVLHLDHMAALNQTPVQAEAINHNVFHLAHTLSLTEEETMTRLNRVLDQHRTEWRAFTQSLGADSFLAAWFTGGQP